MIIEVLVENKKVVLKETKWDNEQLQEYFDGGIYMFLLSGIPLYVGETNVFMSRLSDHLLELIKDADYFGLSELSGNYKLEMIILESGYPYNAIINGKKRKSDANAKERRRLEKDAINKYRPILQRPLEKEYPRSRKGDGMIANQIIKCKIVKKFCVDSTEYATIVKEIEKQKKLINEGHRM